jgi:c-di-GMP-binding flagellar brake protein YcgR
MEEELSSTKKKAERRNHPRHDVKIPVKFRCEKSEGIYKSLEDWRGIERHGFTLDLSLGGMSLVVDDPLQVGEVLRFDLYLLDKKEVVSLFGAVRWSNEKGVGLRFLGVKPEEMEALGEFLSKVYERKSAVVH